MNYSYIVVTDLNSPAKLDKYLLNEQMIGWLDRNSDENSEYVVLILEILTWMYILFILNLDIFFFKWESSNLSKDHYWRLYQFLNVPCLSVDQWHIVCPVKSGNISVQVHFFTSYKMFQVSWQLLVQGKGRRENQSHREVLLLDGAGGAGGPELLTAGRAAPFLLTECDVQTQASASSGASSSVESIPNHKCYSPQMPRV